VLTSYAGLGAGFNSFVDQATGADPWRNLGKVFLGDRLDRCLPCDLQLDRGQLERRGHAATRVFYSLCVTAAPQALGDARAVQDARTSRSSG